MFGDETSRITHDESCRDTQGYDDPKSTPEGGARRFSYLDRQLYELLRQKISQHTVIRAQLKSKPSQMTQKLHLKRA